MRRPWLGTLLLIALLVACGAQPSGGAPTSAPQPTAATTAAPAAATAAPVQPTGAPATAETPAAAATAPAGGARPTLTLMTHDSFNVSEDVLKEFEQQNNVTVQVLKSGDAGAALNKAILSKSSPLADVFFGVDNTFLSRALKAGIFDAYAAPALASIPERFRLDPANTLLPIDYGYVNINYDKEYLAKNQLTQPTKLEDLTKPEWKGKLVVENPATSSPGLAFVLATIAQFGTSGSYSWLDYWRDLRKNDVLVSDSWNDAYYTHFSGSSGKGPRPLVVSYATSPAAELVFSETNPKPTEPPTGNLLAGSFLQVEFAGILKGTKQRDLAEKLIDFMLSKRFQEDVPLQMFVYPVLPDAALPDVFKQFAQVPDQPLGLPPEQIDQNREQWIDAWTKAVLR
ncbi:MAG TPA: thiamine ABC transporter substrate-binding protein [Roseiflexaceae bacterium]|nr:thiamine ABC transporter substrate-binding protein [Roseiflexaceae bacterium]